MIFYLRLAFRAIILKNVKRFGDILFKSRRMIYYMETRRLLGRLRMFSSTERALAQANTTRVVRFDVFFSRFSRATLINFDAETLISYTNDDK